MNNHQPLHQTMWTFILLTGFMLAGIYGGSWSTINYAPDALPANTYVNGITVQGKTPEETLALLENQLPTTLTVLLVNEQQEKLLSFPLARGEIKGSYAPAGLYHGTGLPVPGSWSERKARLSIFPPVRNYTVPFHYEPTALIRWVEQVTDHLPREPADARITVINGQPEIIRETLGIQLEPDRLLNLLVEALKRHPLQPVELSVPTVNPRLTAAELPDFSQKIAGFASPVGDDANRLENIKLAGALVNEQIIQPGEIFSFAAAVGQITAQRGFLPAPVIKNMQLVTDIGGGIRQLSSTLYRTALAAKLPVLERHNNSLPPDYIPLGFDAAVAYGQIDFRMQNPFPYPILLAAWTDEEEVHTAIFGPAEHKTEKVELLVRELGVIQRQVETIYDERLPKNIQRLEQEGSDGYRVAVYRLTYLENGDTQEELISTDTYLPVRKIVRAGTGAEIIDK